ncbi:MAG: hypothetical protein R3B57_08070 [Phycisphaerales bacterium]
MRRIAPRLALERGLHWREQGRFLNTFNEHGKNLAVVLAGIAPPLAFLPLPLVIVAAVAGRGVGIPGVVFAVAFSVGMAVLLPRLLAGKAFVARRAAALSVLRCPGCAYSLASASRDDDGYVVCPECGAAWRIRLDGMAEERT